MFILSNDPKLLEDIKSKILNIDFKYYLNLYDFQKISFAINFLHFNTNDPFIDFFIDLVTSYY